MGLVGQIIGRAKAVSQEIVDGAERGSLSAQDVIAVMDGVQEAFDPAIDLLYRAVASQQRAESPAVEALHLPLEDHGNELLPIEPPTDNPPAPKTPSLESPPQDNPPPVDEPTGAADGNTELQP